MGKVENLEELTQEFDCKIGALLSSYLSLPLGTQFKFVAVWDDVEERLRKRLSIWKISKGWLTLIHNIVSSMPIYFIQ